MESSLLESLGKIAGIGGISLGIFLLLFQGLLKKLKVPGLKQDQWFRIIIVFMVLVWSVALSGLGAWYFSSVRQSSSVVEKAFGEKSIPLFIERVHLGDNVFSRVGGMVFPSQDQPTISKNEDIVYYDKETGQFSTYFGATTGVQFIAAVFKDYYKAFNLGAWKHVVAEREETTLPDEYDGASVQIDFDTVLRWEKGKGNFYDRVAAVARTRSINVFNELMKIGVDPRNNQVTSAWIRMSGFHGGKRRGQSDNMDILIDNQRYLVNFQSHRPRNEEFIEVPINILQIDPANPIKNTIFSIVVLPYQEQLPVPPPSEKLESIGPAHFRDIEIGEIQLVLQLSA